MSEAERRERESPGRSTEPEGRQGVSPWEWVAAAIGSGLVIGAIGILGYEALGIPATPPAIEIRVDSVLQVGGGYLVEFHARNTGTTTAAGVVVEGELTTPEGTVETSGMTIDYVPARASRGGGLYFSHDPRRHRLEIRPKGYDLP